MESVPREISAPPSGKEGVFEAESVHKEVEAQGAEHHKSKKEKRLLLKQDLSIVLLLFGCYWFAYLVCSSRAANTSNG